MTIRKTMSVRLDFTWDEAVAVEQDMIERLCGYLAGRAEDFLVIEGEGIYQSGLDDVTVGVYEYRPVLDGPPFVANWNEESK